MRYKYLFALCCLFAYADGPVCEKGPRPRKIALRHIEPGGVGYHPGYTTLDGFFDYQDPWDGSWLPFFDLRLHLLNNQRVAGNAGLGIRYTTSRIWGANAYYDYRLTMQQPYNQVSIGFETLGKVWDFRINGYLPLGAKKSSKFGGRREFALKSANVEIGVRYSPLYAALGPYYLEGYYSKISWGGKVRIALDITDYFQIEAISSYDKLFQWIGQGQLSLIIPFGSRKVVRPKDGRSCAQELCLQKRALSPVGRNEIIPVFH